MREDQDFLQASSQVIAALADVPSPAALLDEQGTIRWQNKASLALRGSRTGRHFAEFVAAENREATRALFAQILTRGESAELDVNVLTAQGMYVPLSGRWSLVPTLGGRKAVVVLSLGDGRPSPDPASAEPAAQLTPRQLDVLRLLAKGRTTQQIASELSLSNTTVRNHIANLLVVLAVHSRLHAVVAAREAGLLDP